MLAFMGRRVPNSAPLTVAGLYEIAGGVWADTAQRDQRHLRDGAEQRPDVAGVTRVGGIFPGGRAERLGGPYFG
jgi:hypothetical protein